MKGHVIRFNGHISWDGQANGLPPTIHAYLIFEGSITQEIINMIELQSGVFLKSQAMAVQRDQGKIIDLRKVPQDRMLVPMRWIVSLDVDVIPMTGELPMPDEAGVERLSDGSEPPKQ